MEFLNSPFFAGLATIVTGGIAIIVYLLQKQSEKINAAVSILFEIRNAENKVDIISEKLKSANALDLPRVLPSNSWEKYSHLFAKNFDEDEFRLINTFFNTCVFIEELVVRQNNYIWITADERGRITQQLLGQVYIKFHEEAVENDDAQKKAQEKFDRLRVAVTKHFTDDQYFYIPQRTLEGLKFSIDHLQKVTTTTCGLKLKKLAKV